MKLIEKKKVNYMEANESGVGEDTSAQKLKCGF